MTLVWAFFVVELCLAWIVRLVVGSHMFIVPVVVALHAVFVLAYIVHMPRYLVPPFAVAFAIRGVLAIYDCLTLKLTPLNVDAFGYYDSAVRMAAGQYEPGKIGSIYSRLLSLVFYCTGPSRGMGEYVDILLGMTTIWLLYLALRRLGAGIRTQMIFIWVLVLFPYSVLNSIITHRETAICPAVMASAYFALCWFQKRRVGSMAACIVCLLFAASCHAGVIAMSIGYAVLFAMYSHQGKKYVVNRRTVPIVLGVSVLAVLVIFVFPNIFLSKLQGAANLQNVLHWINTEYGNSMYLRGMNVQSVADVILYAPIKTVYFLLSPLPGDWRGIVDMAVFFVDGMVYFFCIVYICRHYKTSAYKKLLLGIGLGWLATAVLFGLSTFNAGTAVRHRNKIFAVLLMMAAMASQKASKPGGADGKTA